MKYLVLGLGNDLLGDDAFGPHAVRRLADIADDCVTVMESAGSGVELLDLFAGFDRALIIDGIITGFRTPGELIEFPLDGLRSTPGPSPHYSGLPELVEIAGRMNLKYPREFLILAVELKDAYTIGGNMCEKVRKAIPSTIKRVRDIIAQWKVQDNISPPVSMETWKKKMPANS